MKCLIQYSFKGTGFSSASGRLPKLGNPKYIFVCRSNRFQITAKLFDLRKMAIARVLFILLVTFLLVHRYRCFLWLTNYCVCVRFLVNDIFVSVDLFDTENK
ncbi:hypothetical protein ACP275_11G088800 [Erythranthe tilingii]